MKKKNNIWKKFKIKNISIRKRIILFCIFSSALLSIIINMLLLTLGNMESYWDILLNSSLMMIYLIPTGALLGYLIGKHKNKIVASTLYSSLIMGVTLFIAFFISKYTSTSPYWFFVFAMVAVLLMLTYTIYGFINGILIENYLKNEKD